MYLDFDLASPIRGEYIHNQRIKNLFLRLWPKTTIDGVEVFDRLVFYSGSIESSDWASRLYTLIGTSVSELDAQSYKGVDKAWFYFNVKGADNSKLTADQIQDYIKTHKSPEIVRIPLVLSNRLFYKYNYYASEYELWNPSSKQNTIQELIDSLYRYGDLAQIYTINGEDKANVFLSRGLVFDEQYDPLTSLALMDVSGAIFERKFSPGGGGLEYSDGVHTPIKSVIFEYRVKEYIDYSSQNVIDSLNHMVERVYATLSPITEESLIGETTTYRNDNVYQQCLDLRRNYIDDSGLPTVMDANGNIVDLAVKSSDGTLYLRTDNIQLMKSSAFVSMLGDVLDTGYKKESKSFLQKLGSFFLAAIGIFLAPLTAGGSLTLTYYAIVTTVYILALTVAAQVMSRTGNSSMAIVFSSSVVIMQPVTQMLGFLMMFTGIGSVIQSAATALTSAASSASVTVGSMIANTWNTVKSIAVNTIAPSTGSTTQTLTRIISQLNTGFKLYIQYVAPVPNPGTPPEPVEPLGTHTVQLVQRDFESYSFLDLNERMDALPDQMTQGFIEQSTQKYYVG